MKFLGDIFLEIEGRKFVQYFASFFASLLKLTGQPFTEFRSGELRAQRTASDGKFAHFKPERSSSDTFHIARCFLSDSTIEHVRACFFWGIARYLCCKMGYRLICLCKTRHQGRGYHSLWGIAGMAEKVSRDGGHRSNTIAISRDMGPLSFKRNIP